MKIKQSIRKEDIETGSLFIDRANYLYIYKFDRWSQKGHLIELDTKNIDLCNEDRLTESVWIERNLGISIEEGKNYFPNSKYSIELVKDGE